jgi:hypothetical protein
MARSRNRCCNGNIIMRSLHIAELHVTLNNMKILSATLGLFYSEVCRRHQ